MSTLRTQSFTTKYSARMGVLFSDAYIAQPFRSSEKSIDRKGHNAVQFKAIWDTGATNTVISQKVVNGCGLKPIGMAKVSTASQKDFETNAYLVSIFLPNKVCLSQLRVTEGVIAGGADILIGMDIISRGDFAVTQFGGTTKLSFRMPSVANIDFVEESKRSSPTVVGPKVGRNDPCPCGSGLKYKKCHGK